MTLIKSNCERYEANVRDIFDNRKKIAKVIVSYYDDKGIEYRKSFTDAPHTPANEMFKNAPEKIIQ